MKLDKENVINALKNAGCIKRGIFKLSSGNISNIYIDIRLLYSKPEELNTILEAMEALLNKLKCDYICGIATGGLPLASMLALRRRKPLLYVRKEAKKYGTKRKVEGIEGRISGKVVIVDDVLTTGSSVLSAVKALRELGSHVEDVIVVVNRSKESNPLTKEGIRLYSLLKLDDILSSEDGL